MENSHKIKAVETVEMRRIGKGTQVCQFVGERGDVSFLIFVLLFFLLLFVIFPLLYHFFISYGGC